MAHELEIDEITGDAAFYSAREVAWHRLGTVTPEALTAQDALTTAHLDNWNVRLVPDVALVEGEFVASAGRSRTVRTHPFTGSPDVLGWVSDDYGIISNEEAFAFLDAFQGESGGTFETAGSIFNGKRVFVTIRMPEDLKVAGDPVETYILFTTTHDGSGPAEALIVPNRVVCSNTLNLAMRGALSRVKVRHTRNAVERMQQAAEVLTATEGYVGSFKAAMERLTTQKLSMADVDLFLEQLFPTDSSPAKAALTQAQNKRNEVRALVLHSPTIQDEFRLTGWGVLNAAAEQYDWFSQVRGADDPNIRRAIRSTFGAEGATFKNKALKILASI